MKKITKTTLRHNDDGTFIDQPFEGSWSRVLTNREVRVLEQNPYQMFVKRTAISGRLRWWHRLAWGLRSDTNIRSTSDGEGGGSNG
jgi:hypothetical protein